LDRELGLLIALWLDDLLGSGTADLVVTQFEGIAGLVRLGTDGIVARAVHIFKTISVDTGGDELRELLGISFLILFLEVTHVLSNVSTEDVVAVNLGISFKLVTFTLLGTGETTVVVGDVKTTITSTLQGTEDTRTSGSSTKTDIEEGLERSGTIIIGFDVVVFTINLGLSFVIKAKLGVDTTGKEETSAISSGIVGQTDLDTISGKLMGVGASEDNIVVHIGLDDLADDILAGDADDETVLGGLVLVLILGNQTLTGIVVSLAFASTTELDLVTLVISSVFYYFNESHGVSMEGLRNIC